MVGGHFRRAVGRSILLYGFVLALGACATHWQKPEIGLTGARLAGGNLLQQRLQVTLRVRNPNGVAIGIESVVFDVLAGEDKLASGQSVAPVTVPARSESTVIVEIGTSLLGLLQRLPSYVAEDGKLHCRIKGEASIRDYGVVLFDHPESLTLPWRSDSRRVPRSEPEDAEGKT